MCRQRLEVARRCLRKGDRPAAVHGARKEIKKLRALFRLVRDNVSARAHRKGVQALRAAANCLAAARDARVTMKAFENLDAAANRKYPDIKAALARRTRREARRFRKDKSVAAADRLLRKTRRHARDLKLKATGWAPLAMGLKRSYQQGRDAWRTAGGEASAENFHAWRRHVKDLWFHLEWLNPFSAKPARRAAKDLERLGELLGEDHDLFLLEKFVVRHCAKHRTQSRELVRQILRRQQGLRKAALQLGSRLYSEESPGTAFYRWLPMAVSGSR
jgi:CHAD domain-containing protein